MTQDIRQANKIEIIFIHNKPITTCPKNES